MLDPGNQILLCMCRLGSDKHRVVTRNGSDHAGPATPIERQADTFAARHMQGTMVQDMAATDDNRFGDRAVYTMIGALQRVADLNHIAPTRRSWRHGSIAWRQNYLRTLIGKPLDDASVDRQLVWIKLASVGILFAVIGIPTILRHS